ncbi:arabinose efflux permease [Gynuella sunshinyii YC6258]|uniref:Arabinose efflux permease n=2 Tax=Gynuella sunshinyii TaxID=1445505 RepID=A0A0C5V3X3_9GAMM|nr:arabinose efflux permease [Gynuella sunshinyii YC6258]
MSGLPVSDERLAAFLILHSVAGLGVGAALSVTHGCIGRTKNPHHLFGIVNVSMGALAIAMFAVMPGMVRQLGGQVIFTAFAITVGISAIYALFFFPTIDHLSVTEKHKTRLSGSMPPVAWMIIGVVICLTLSQSMVFSFVERIGVNRGFESSNIQAMFVIMGFINLLPGILAALMQKRLSPISVSFSGPVLQALAALTLTSSSSFLLFAIPVSVYVTLAIFTHTFLFGLLSKIDPSGRAVAATPAMMMIGSASGPVLGGLIVSVVGYHGLGWGVAVIACVASTLTFQARTLLSQSNRSSALTNTKENFIYD